MADIQYLEGPGGRRLAYALTAGAGPCVVFLSGYKSDMDGTKAVHLEAWAAASGRAFLRLDYSGHGRSEGLFEQGCIGDWAADAEAVITAVAPGDRVIVGSSMGGWIGLLLCQRLSGITGFVGIAAAPDFTEDGFWATFTEAQRKTIMSDGQVALPSEYGEDYIITRKLIEDGRQQLVLRDSLALSCPVRLLQGTEDTAVTRDRALALLDHLQGPDVRLTLVKGVDHRFSEPDCLRLIEEMVQEVMP